MRRHNKLMENVKVKSKTQPQNGLLVVKRTNKCIEEKQHCIEVKSNGDRKKAAGRENMHIQDDIHVEHVCSEPLVGGGACGGIGVNVRKDVDVSNINTYESTNTNLNIRKAVIFTATEKYKSAEDEVRCLDSGVVIRSQSGRRKKKDQIIDHTKLSDPERDSGLGNESHIVETCSTFNTTSKPGSGSYEFQVLTVAALNGNIGNMTKSRLLGRFRARSKRQSKTLLIETAWPSTVWYVPPPFEDQTVVLNNLFEAVRSSKKYMELSPSAKHILEAKMEVVSSEASYLRSLHTMQDHFMYSNELSDEAVLSRSDKQSLFADVPAMIRCSKEFLRGLQQCLADDLHMGNIFQFVKNFAKDHFHVFVKYCSNLKYIQETHTRLMCENVKFNETLRCLEESPVCERLPLNSFLSLPLGRILKLDLPIKEALRKMTEDDVEYLPCKEASEILKKFGHDCNEGAARFECLGDTLKIANKLDFPEKMAAIPISSSSRCLLKQGSLTHHTPRHSTCNHTDPVYVFLFNDLLVVTRKQSDECYVVIEYCSRDLAILTTTKGLSHLPVRFTGDCDTKFMLLLTIVKQQCNIKTEMVLSCRTERERQEWLAAASSETQNCIEYKSWNRPKVSTVLPFIAEEPNQLSLHLGDEVHVIKQMDDDWYEGIRMSDGSRGVFPGSHTTVVSEAHAHVRSLKKLYLLLNEDTDEEQSAT